MASVATLTFFLRTLPTKMDAHAGSRPEWLSTIRHDNDAPALRFAADHGLTYSDIARRIERLAPAFAETKKLIAIEGRNSEHSIIAVA